MDSRAPNAALDPGLTGQQARPVPGIDNGYLAGYRVRFDEAGANGLLRTSALLRYAQDVAWRHSEQLGFDRAWYQARGLGWVVRGCELEVRAAIPIGHTLRVSTAVVGHRRIWARRLGECRLADGRVAATVTTDWVLLDARNRVVRIPADFGFAFTNPEVRSEIVRVAAPAGAPAVVRRLRVRPSDLDPLDHVNNAVYVDWLEEALEEAGWGEAITEQPRSYRLEYLASAARGDEVEVAVHGPGTAWSAVIRRADGGELVRAQGARTA
ncbi:MAG TPA: acyl-ACP thioesterase domain-containing protein [Patescibacteria group bacterium]|nr:acyl-ACP thioesterase domain-containing protein [Patescibacteria group bacterium]